MKSPIFLQRWASFFVGLVIILSMVSAPASERVALVIGNDAYQHARRLGAAVNDAAAVGDALRKLDFKVILISDAGVEAMLEAMAQLKREAEGAESILVYYAGHGIEIGSVNYLIPVDAKLEREIQLKTQAISLDQILEDIKQVKVPARMVILDCCRDNPLEGRSWLATRSGGGGLASLAQDRIGEATLVVYSASPGKPAMDRMESEKHSPFTSALLEQLSQPDVHSFEMFGLVEDGVIKRTAGRQAPRIFYNGSTQPFRNFRFTPKGTIALKPSSQVIPESPPERIYTLADAHQMLDMESQIASLEGKVESVFYNIERTKIFVQFVKLLGSDACGIVTAQDATGQMSYEELKKLEDKTIRVRGQISVGPGVYGERPRILITQRASITTL